MSIAINYQREQIKKYFKLLVAEFITDPKHKNVDIIFQDFSDSPLILGHTRQTITGGGGSSETTWQTTINGIKIPGSERTTHHPTPYQYKYEIQFLARGYKNEDELRGTVVHEFTHLYLFSTIGKHVHDDRFYSEMERLESWLNQNQKLSPRVDKSHDRDQYVGDNNINLKENICPECSKPTPQHSLCCSRNQINACWECQRVFGSTEKYYQDANSLSTDNPPTYCQDCVKKNVTLIKGIKVLVDNKNVILDPQKLTEFDRLSKLLRQSPDATTLEKNYQMTKNSSLYSDQIFTGKNKLKNKDNKKVLDGYYEMQKWFLNNRISSTSLNKNRAGNNSNNILWLFLVISWVALVALIAYLIGRKQSFEPKYRNRKI